MSDLYLHMGHGKTGSSFLQSVLCRSIDALSRHGFSFPIDPALAAFAAEGHTTSGNINEFRTALAEGPPAHGKLLFSSEYLFLDMEEPDFADRFGQVLRAGRFDRVHVLLFLRDPVHFALAEYHQRAKSDPEDKSAEEWLATWDRISLVDQVLGFLAGFPKVRATVLNYDVRKASIVPILADWLGLPRDALSLPPRSRTNRALTIAEESLVQSVARRKARVYSARLADTFSASLPDIVATPDLPPLAAQQALWDRLRPWIDRVNARLAPEDHYDIARDIRAPLAPLPSDTALSPAQMSVLADYIAWQGHMIDLAKAEAERHRLALEQLRQDLRAALDRPPDTRA